MNATFLSKVGWIPIVDSIRGIFHVVYKDPKKATEAYKRYLKGGGGFSTLRSVDRTVFDKDVHTILNKGIMRNEYSGLLGPFKYLTDASELSTRVMMNEKSLSKSKKNKVYQKEMLYKEQVLKVEIYLIIQDKEQ